MSPGKPDLYIYGAGGHGKVVLDAARSSGAFSALYFLDDYEALHGTRVLDAEVLGSESSLPFPHPNVALFPAMGDNVRRLRLVNKFLDMGYQVPPVVHARAWISPFAHLEAGAVAMAGAVVNPDARVGRGAIINTGATVDHDCLIGPGAHVAPGANLSGTVTLGECARVGTGACVVQGVAIGEHAVIAAGASVTRDIEGHVLAAGVPAKVVKRLEPAS